MCFFFSSSSLFNGSFASYKLVEVNLLDAPPTPLLPPPPLLRVHRNLWYCTCERHWQRQQQQHFDLFNQLSQQIFIAFECTKQISIKTNSTKKPSLNLFLLLLLFILHLFYQNNKIEPIKKTRWCLFDLWYSDSFDHLREVIVRFSLSVVRCGTCIEIKSEKKKMTWSDIDWTYWNWEWYVFITGLRLLFCIKSSNFIKNIFFFFHKITMNWSSNFWSS